MSNVVPFAKPEDRCAGGGVHAWEERHYATETMRRCEKCHKHEVLLVDLEMHGVNLLIQAGRELPYELRKKVAEELLKP